MITAYHAKYFASELTKRCSSDSIEKFAGILTEAQVDLNPHQIDAALFAFRSPLSNGAILADEVGLGKTIEAGILLSQKWAERKRKILIIVPANLRKQWNQELLDKFYLPSAILEAKSFNQETKKGNFNPFEQDKIIICSYQFAFSKDSYVKNTNWDLVVIDEAHRLRNVHKKTNKTANKLKEILEKRKKVLLTATPLQNSLLELYGLVSFIDEHTFGDKKSFNSQFTRLANDDEFTDLKARLKPICHRTLRRQVAEYVPYTNRICVTEEFIPSPDEQALYELVSEYLQKETLYALPSSQRHLMTLILRKLLASSTYAITGTLEKLAFKLENLVEKHENGNVEEIFKDEIETFDELEEEWEEDEEEDKKKQTITDWDIPFIKAEISELKSFFSLSESIVKNSKGEHLLTALKKGFEKAKELGASEKTIIFTESTRTQSYLKNILENTEYAGKIVLFNGSNSDSESKEIYQKWLKKHDGADKITGSMTADKRAAIVEFFKEEAKIMIATEAASEGVNLQFCSMIVNYDLPWNPQRIEQRIGRCHRYGQKYDVVVVNFLNLKNEADKRVYDLLKEKFKLFSGVFGASDEILGSIESGVDFEKRIAQIYQTCRTKEEIKNCFDALQNELEKDINEKILTTRQKLLENFDDEVREKLKVNLNQAKENLSKYETLLWSLTQHGLDGYAEFNKHYGFNLVKLPFNDLKIPLGNYELGKNIEHAYTYRLGHPLAQRLIETAKQASLSCCEVVFDYTNSTGKISILENLIGKNGKLALYKVTIEALEAEDYLIFAGMTQDGQTLDQEQCQRLFSLNAISDNNRINPEKAGLIEIFQEQKNDILQKIDVRNSSLFDEEMDKLDRWAKDQRKSLKLNLKELEDEIQELSRSIRKANNLPDKVKLQKKKKDKEEKLENAEQNYRKESREINRKKDALLDETEAKLRQRVTEELLFMINWKLI